MKNATKTEVTKSVITLNEEKGIYKAEYQKRDKRTGKGTLSVELRQTVTTKDYYPGIKVSNERSASLFPIEAFGLETEPYINTEKRVAWLSIPEDATIEQVHAMVAHAVKNEAEIYRVLSFAPIITEDQQYAIDNALKTIDDFAGTQAMRYPENEKTVADGTANTLILDAKTGNVQYRKTFFWNVPRADEDNRDINNVYVSPALKTELEGAATFAGQEIN